MEIITNYDATLEPGLDNMPLLLNMEAFWLGQLLDLGTNTNYIGGLEDPASNGDMEPSPEYADFTNDDSEDEVDEDSIVQMLLLSWHSLYSTT